jgi:hypothetical protein
MHCDLKPMRRNWSGYVLVLLLGLACQGCATAIVMIPIDSVEYGHQEIVGAAIGLPADIANSTLVGAMFGPPGALIGALVGIAVAAGDFWIVSRIGQL